MGWLSHPAYKPVRDRLVKRLAEQATRYKHLRKLIFVCGKRGSHGRVRLKEYLTSRYPAILVFYAETVWAILARQRRSNALQMERRLALLADLVVIIVESEGTCAELGAFASIAVLREKLLPIIDRRYRDEASFINIGPIAWVDDESLYGPTIYTNVAAILGVGNEINLRIERIPEHGRLPGLQRQVSLRDDLKRILFFLSDLVGVIGPATEEDCAFYVEKTFGEVKELSVPELLALARALNLIRSLAVDGTDYFFRALQLDPYQSYMREDLFDIAEERARVLSAYQRIDEAVELISRMRTL